MDAGVDGGSPGVHRAGRDAGDAEARVDRAMPWLMVGLAVSFAVCAFGFMEPLRRGPSAVVGALFVLVALLWTCLALAASVLAVRHAGAQPSGRLLARLAWCWVPVVFVVGLPVAIYLASDHIDAHEDGRVCIEALLPASVPEALFGWLPDGVYPWVHAVMAAAGLALLAPASTRRPAAWILAGTLMTASLLIGGAITSINQCD